MTFVKMLLIFFALSITGMQNASLASDVEEIEEQEDEESKELAA